MTADAADAPRLLTVNKAESSFVMRVTTMHLLVSTLVGFSVFVGALWTGAQLIVGPLIDARVKAAIIEEDQKITREFASQSALVKLEAQKDERWTAQYRVNTEIRESLATIQADIKRLLLRGRNGGGGA